jgi:hypothetical protein
MIEAITAFYEEHQLILGIIAGGSVLMFIGSILSLPFLVALIPVDYFQYADPYRAHHTFKHPVIRLTIIIVKNLLGWLLIIVGIIMLVLPGQGMITTIAGLLLINFPHKRKLERRLVSNQTLLNSINWLRARRSKAPLLAPE